MQKDNWFKIEFIILTELYEHKKENTRVVLEDISPERFGIADGYLLDIIEGLLEEGYVKGPLIRQTKTGRAVAGMQDLEITRAGVAYLQDNSKMKKVYNALKEIKDWVPGM